VGAVVLDIRGCIAVLASTGGHTNINLLAELEIPHTWVLDSGQKSGDLHQILGLESYWTSSVEAISRLPWEYLVREMETWVSLLFLCVSAVINKAS